jgi:DNA-binding response OmpR family regulator
MDLAGNAVPEEDTKQVRFKEILIVDQDEAWAFVMRDAVAGGGFCVTIATSLEEAVRKVRVKTPDLILVSCLLDVERAQALLSEIEQLPSTPPVVLVGMRHGDVQWDAWKQRRFVSVVPQPFKSRDILDVALALLGSTWEELTGDAS